MEGACHRPSQSSSSLVLDIERGLGMQCRNNPRARIDGTPNALGEAFLEDEDDDDDEDEDDLSRGLARAS